MIGGHALPGQQQFPVVYEGEAGLPEQPAGPIEGAVGGAYDEQFAEQFKHSVNNTRDGEHFSKWINMTERKEMDTQMSKILT